MEMTGEDDQANVDAFMSELAGLVRFPEGVFVWGPHVPGSNVPVRQVLEQEFGVPAVVDNDANAAAWAELQLGAARGRECVGEADTVDPGRRGVADVGCEAGLDPARARRPGENPDRRHGQRE